MPADIRLARAANIRLMVVVVTLGSVVGCGSAPGLSSPHGQDAHPTIVFEPPEPRYEERIQRIARDSLDAFLIAVAESHYPSRDSVEAVIGRKAREGFERPPMDEPVWWYTTFDRIRIPFAITGAAVEYYREVLRANREGRDFPEGGVHNVVVDLSYRAEVEHHPVFRKEGLEFTDVYVVSMDFSWSNVCGILCALSIWRRQQTVLTDTGRVLYVFGWRTGYIVS